MKNKIICLLSLLIVGTLIFSSCTTTETPAAEVTEETTSESEPVKIGVYSLAWSPSSINMMKQLIEKFNAEHEGKIVAEYIQGSWDDVETYIAAGVSGGGGIADVIEYYIGGALAWYQQGYLMDLSPYVTDEVKATLPEVLWNARTTEDGAIYESCTVTGNHLLIYYNPALFEAAGITPPATGETWTWEQFMENAKLLTVDANGKRNGEEGFDPNNVVQWGFVPRLDNEKVWEEISTYALQASKKPMIRKGDDGTWDIFFDEEAMPAIETYMNIINEKITPTEAVGLDGSSQDELFHQGTAAMVQREYFNVAVLHDNYPDFEFSVMPIPMEPGSKSYQTTSSGQGFSVPVTTEHPAEAAEFVFWMQKAENQALWTSALMMGPCNPEALNDPVIQENPDLDAMRFYYGIEETVDSEINPNESEFVTTVYGPTMMDVLLGNITLEDAISIIKSGSKDVLNK